MTYDMGLYDSDTECSLEPLKVVDVSDFQTRDEHASLAFTRAQRGRIVQLESGCTRIHYFLDEPGGRAMMDEDASRFGFDPGELLALADQHAPVSE